jgi:microcystin-dependent protein
MASTSPYLGQIAVYGFGFVPTGWAPCDGSLMPIQENVPLMQLIGTTYGGNGETTFALPKLPPVTPDGPYYFIALQGMIPAP